MLFFQQISILPHGCFRGIYTSLLPHHFHYHPTTHVSGKSSFASHSPLRILVLKAPPSLNFQQPSMGWIWIFSGTTHSSSPHTFTSKRQWHQFRAFSSSLGSFLSHGLKYSSHVLAGFIVECIRRKSPTSVMWRAVTKPSRHQLNYHAMHSDTLEKNPINVINVIKLLLDMMTSSDITAFILVGTPCIITVQSVRFDT